VGSDLPLAGGKAKIPERYQEQMCGCIETLTDAIHIKKKFFDFYKNF
jgi:hypothetical protein